MNILQDGSVISLPHDPLGAFCRENHVVAAGAECGPLAGLTFAVKDVFDVKGSITGFGHPDWLKTHAAAIDTAATVQQLLDAGATMVGKTVTDELTYSLSGQNYHYGTPVNPRDPARVPGGSSSGSASAVAGGLVDFALGTDCGGSVRVPASYCGLFGIRPTHGRVSLEGAIPFAPSFDCAGWFARDMALFGDVTRVVLGNERSRSGIGRIVVAQDAMAELHPHVRAAMMSAISRVEMEIGSATKQVLAGDGLPRWSETFRILQAAEIWESLGGWIQDVRPVLGPGIRDRFMLAEKLEPSIVAAAKEHRSAIRRRLSQVLPSGTVLLLPSAPCVAPAVLSENDEIEVRYRHQAMNLLCIAGLGGLPQISLPMVEMEGLPIGLSLVGAEGSDLALLELAERIWDRT